MLSSHRSHGFKFQAPKTRGESSSSRLEDKTKGCAELNNSAKMKTVLK